jgi:hypothetical protein
VVMVLAHMLVNAARRIYPKKKGIAIDPATCAFPVEEYPSRQVDSNRILGKDHEELDCAS